MKQIDTCTILEDAKLDEVEITPKQYNDILNIQQEILYMIASHEKSSKVLNHLCKMAESLLDNCVASIMFLNKETNLMSVLNAPSIPQVGHDALENLKPGPYGGSCGNAVFKNEAQFVQNTFEDERWNNLKHIAFDFNLCSCWSMPIRDKNKNAIGSFALSSFEHRSPALFHKKLLETAASIVNIVLKNEENEKRINIFSTAIENASEGMIITDSNNNIIEVNNSFEKIYGYKESEVIGLNPKVIASGDYSKKFYNSMWEDINTSSNWSGEITNKKKNGELITQWMSVSALYDENKKAQNYLAVFTDLTELKNTQKKIEYMAYHDSLTKLNNKTYLEKIINNDKDKYTLLLLNINNFSHINTAYGFKSADDLLIKLASIFKTNFNIYKISRINADEFALLFKGKISIEEKVYELKKYFNSNVIDTNKLQLNISFSYGASYGNKYLLRNAASALKKSKENGKNRLYIFDEKLDTTDYTQSESFINTSKLLRDAISNDLVLPYFQGIYNNKTKVIEKYEALVRIEKDGKVISPFVFLETAKLTGLLPEITKIVIDKTFKVMQTNTHTFSINITEDDLSHDYLISYLEQKTKEYNINENRVILEILEGISASGKKNHIKQLSILKQRGYKIAIDDFGAEYSNFERILDLEIDFIKIDAKYIKDINTNPKSYEIARAISFFAKNVNIPCIAEFVHNKEVHKIVDKLGIDYSQGYYFSEPNAKINN